jgi:hypothetical protein
MIEWTVSANYLDDTGAKFSKCVVIMLLVFVLNEVKPEMRTPAIDRWSLFAASSN